MSEWKDIKLSPTSLPISDYIAYGIALIVLATSIPFYALARVEDNFVSYYSRSFLAFCLPQVLIDFFEKIVSVLTMFPVLGDGIPSGLWCLAWTLILLTIWRTEITHCREAQLWCSLPFLANGVWEGLQWGNVIPGTGTLADCLFGGLGAVTALVIHRFFTNHQRGRLWQRKE